jgi:hypothetical protein
MRKDLDKQDHFTFPFLFPQCSPPDFAGAGAGRASVKSIRRGTFLRLV